MAITINGDGLIEVGGTSTTQGRVRLAEDTDNGANYIELTAPASVASNRTVTFPDATTTVVGTDATQTLTNKTLTSPTITGASMSSMASSVITSGTEQASTSGTSIDFTGIPSWAKRITVMFSGVSINSTSGIAIQLGDSGGIETTGYTSGVVWTGGANAIAGSTTQFLVTAPVSNAEIYSGSVVITAFNTTNTWIEAGILARESTGGANQSGGSKTLSATLDRVRIKTVNGTDTFDLGSINILYE